MMPYFDSENQDNEIVFTPIIYSYHKEKRGIVNSGTEHINEAR